MENLVYKFTLGSKKVIYLKEPKISDTESCIQMAGTRAKENIALLGLLTQKELFKKLLVQINDKKLSNTEKENLDALFTMKEWSQCLQALQNVSGGDEEVGNLEAPEITSFGEK